MKALIAFEDGTIFEGKAFGETSERSGEVVFNTSLTGYQEIITDPSYKGQIVAMTYPLIGNYGINFEDVESRRPFIEGFIIKEKSKIASNWRSKTSLDAYLKNNDVFGIEGVDTRAITRHIRLKGAMKAVLSTSTKNPRALAEKAKKSQGLDGVDLVKRVSSQKPYTWSNQGKYNIAVLDCGVKFNILRSLADRGCKVTVYPYFTSAENILAENPDGILISNGPGDPAAVPYVPETVRVLLGVIPIFGICLGQQMIGLAMGGKTFKLKFGHHGGNHPVKDLRTGKISITVQNHGYCVDLKSLKKNDFEITHMNLNDNTLEGIRHKRLPMFSVQFHPECHPGPHDASYLFDEFIEMVKEHKKKPKKCLKEQIYIKS